MRKRKWFAGAVIGSAAGALIFKSHRHYQHDRQAALVRVAARNQKIQTSLGPIVYGRQGTGTPVFVIHGAGGGFDQALYVTEGLAEGFEWIAPSRFGYLGTPLPAEGSPQDQADAHIALMDALGIERAPIIGISAGGPSALQFALRYPERCTGLVMMSGVSQEMLAVSPNLEAVERVLNRLHPSEYLVWLGIQLAMRRVVMPLGVPSEVLPHLTEADKARLKTFLEYVLPIKERLPGLIHDYMTILKLGVFPLEKIQVPTLIIHARDDYLVTLKHAQFCAENIPNAQFVELPYGGHLRLGQRAQLRAAVSPFLEMVRGNTET